MATCQPVVRVSYGDLQLNENGNSFRKENQTKVSDWAPFSAQVIDELETKYQYKPPGKITFFDTSLASGLIVHVNSWKENCPSEAQFYKVPHYLLGEAITEVQEEALYIRGMVLAQSTETCQNEFCHIRPPLVNTILQEVFPVDGSAKFVTMTNLVDRILKIQETSGSTATFEHTKGHLQEGHRVYLLKVSGSESAAAASASTTVRVLGPGVARIKGNVIRGTSNFDSSKWVVKEFDGAVEAESI